MPAGAVISPYLRLSHTLTGEASASRHAAAEAETLVVDGRHLALYDAQAACVGRWLIVQPGEDNVSVSPLGVVAVFLQQLWTAQRPGSAGSGTGIRVTTQDGRLDSCLPRLRRVYCLADPCGAPSPGQLLLSARGTLHVPGLINNLGPLWCVKTLSFKNMTAVTHIIKCTCSKRVLFFLDERNPPNADACSSQSCDGRQI